MPQMLSRVVSGVLETMQTFSFTRVFKSVDFPTLGLPIMATFPALNMKILYEESLFNERDFSSACLFVFLSLRSSEASQPERHMHARKKMPQNLLVRVLLLEICTVT